MRSTIRIAIDEAALRLALPELYRELYARMDPAKRYRISTAWDGGLVLSAEEIVEVPVKTVPKLVASKA